MSLAAEAVELFAKKYGTPATAVAFAPGRVEIMGNHTDYNGGFVLPAALDKGTVVAAAAADHDAITLYAADFGREARFSARAIKKDPANSWANYLLGVVEQLQKLDVKIGGFTALVRSDVPTGAGLSSSAALEVATALALKELFGYELERMQIARLCQRAENEFVGAKTGILDQFSSLFGRADSLLFLDCQSLAHDTIEMGRSDLSIVIADSGVKHALAGGDYNTRFAECMAAAAHFGKTLLRDVTWDEFVEGELDLPENQRKRARHILLENARVLAMREAIAGTDLAPIGRLFAESHASSRDLFENSSPELDYLVDEAGTLPGFVGGKLSGGGWGGATVNLVLTDAVPEFARALGARYKAQHGNAAAIYTSRAGAGAHVVEG